jgi:uncharacterized membrane protein
MTEVPGGDARSASAPPLSTAPSKSHAAWFAARRRAAADHEAEEREGRSSTGLSPHMASVLCYVGAWLSALIFLILERDSRLVRFHALQATYAFGLLCVAGVACGALTVVSAFYSTAAFKFFAVASEVAWVAMAVVWVMALICVMRNESWRMPLVGRFVDRRV